MLQYVDEFICTANDSAKTMVIHFKQNEPVSEITETGEVVTHMTKNNIISIIVDADSARALSNLITQILDQDN